VVNDDFLRQLARGRARVQLLLDGSDPLSSARVGAAVAQVAAAYQPGIRVRTVDDPLEGRGSLGPPTGPIVARQRFWFNPTLSDSRFYLAALPVMLLINLCLSASTLGLVGERESGTYEQMLALPTTPTEIVLGKLLPLVGVSFYV